MTEHMRDELHHILYEQDRNSATLKEVHEIYQMVAKYLINYPFEKEEYLGFQALEYLCKNYTFETVLDVGCGEGYQSEAFLKNGKTVTAIDYGKSNRISQMQLNNSECFDLIIDDINTYEFGCEFDVVWAGHVLEHQLDVQQFLTKIFSFCREGGVIAITVPPYKSEIIGGHVSLWNPGMLLYRMILAGVNCRHAHIKKYGYNISCIVEKESINVIDKIGYDVGDLRILKEYFPENLVFSEEGKGRDYVFEGNFEQLNW